MSSDRVDWDRMRVFRVVAELGSMTAAAARLGGSVPTISRRITELERDLKTELIKRSTRGVELTEAGKLLLRHANIMADAMDAVQMEVADTDTPIEGPIHFSTGDGLGPYWIAPRLPEFHRKHPKIELKLTISDAVPDLLNNEADVAIQFTEPKRPDLIVKRLGVLHYLCFATEDYLSIYGEPTSLFEFEHHRCLFHQGYVEQIERWAPKTSDLSKLIDFSLVTNSASAMISACEAGGGIAVLPSYIGNVYPKLVPLNLPEIAPIQFWLTYTERVRRLPRGQAVIDWVKQVFDPHATPWFREKFVHPNKINEPEALAALLRDET